MRRKDKEITSREEIDALIRGCTVCHLSFAIENEPYVLPISFGYDGKYLFIHTALSGKKIDWMTRNARVSFAMERHVRLIADESDPCRFTFAFESVLGMGHVQEVTDLNKKQYGLNQIMQQYTGRQWSFEPKAFKKVRIWRIEIETLTGKRSGPPAAV